jgi:hypothetical protein
MAMKELGLVEFIELLKPQYSRVLVAQVTQVCASAMPPTLFVPSHV